MNGRERKKERGEGEKEKPLKSSPSHNISNKPANLLSNHSKT